MFEHFDFAKNPYEVVKSIGFRMRGENQDGEPLDCEIRIDVIRFFGEQEYAPLLWQANHRGSNFLMLHTGSDRVNTRSATPDGAIEAALQTISQWPYIKGGVEKL